MRGENERHDVPLATENFDVITSIQRPMVHATTASEADKIVSLSSSYVLAN